MDSMLVRFVKGFTLVELALAMAFVGVLSISIVLIISNTVSAYQRGLTLTRVNSVGTDLANDMRLSIGGSSASGMMRICETKMFENGAASLSDGDIVACKNNNAYNYTYVVKNKNIGGGRTIPIYGAFCTGNYSYMWNSGYFISGDGMNLGDEWIRLSYSITLDNGKSQTVQFNENKYFRLIKVKDVSRSVCVAMRNVKEHRYDGVTNIVMVEKIGDGKLGGEPIDLLPNDGGNSLAIYDLYVAEPAISVTDDNLFYSVSFVLGTATGGADILANGNNCAAPKDLVSGSSNYCAINKFNFTMQVNGGEIK
ncbi:hypothetical protein J5868_02275 [Candidatus Saccharibacteria bacterium]|nr:hypothetical protein [Candidatus Saccharibacteria bacterium]